MITSWSTENVNSLNKLTVRYVIYKYDVKRKSHEQEVITKKRVATHTNYFLNFKTALYSSALVLKLFNNSRKLF